jgi:anaerobic C4-dicarboxylate transporter
MPSRPTLLFILALPVGAVVYTVAAQVIETLFPKEPILSLLIPLFFAGLAMMPLIIPFFDRKAKQDLAEYHRLQEAEASSVADDAEHADDQSDADDPSAAADDAAHEIASDSNDTGGTDR